MARANPDGFKINPSLVSFCRAVHIYLTMLGLFVMLLFGVTGLTINHEVALGAARAPMVERSGQVPPALLASRDHRGVLASLRQSLGVQGAVTNFADLPDELAIAFKGPGEVWDISIAKPSGVVTARTEKYGWVALVNNLHRGRYTGAAWSWIIDLSAVLIVLACATGFVLWLALPKRRRWGVAWLVVGTIATVAVMFLFVPGPDIPLP